MFCIIVIKCSQCDFSGEYTSNKFCELLDTLIKFVQILIKGMELLKKNGCILETTRFLLLSTSISFEFWGEIVLTMSMLSTNFHLLLYQVSLSKSCMVVFLIILP